MQRLSGHKDAFTHLNFDGEKYVEDLLALIQKRALRLEDDSYKAWTSWVAWGEAWPQKFIDTEEDT